MTCLLWEFGFLTLIHAHVSAAVPLSYGRTQVVSTRPHRRAAGDMLPSVVVVGLMLIAGGCGQNPAVQVTLTNKGLQYGKAVLHGVGPGAFHSGRLCKKPDALSPCQVNMPEQGGFRTSWSSSPCPTSAGRSTSASSAPWTTHSRGRTSVNIKNRSILLPGGAHGFTHPLLQDDLKLTHLTPSCYRVWEPFAPCADTALDLITVSSDLFAWLRSASSNLLHLLSALPISITITKCDLPEPSAEFYQDSTGFKASMLGLSVAISGGWMTHYGVMWVPPNLCSTCKPPPVTPQLLSQGL